MPPSRTWCAGTVETVTTRRHLWRLLGATGLVVALAWPAAADAGSVHPATCMTTSALATWSLPDLIDQLLVVPVQAEKVAQAGPVATAGYGGIIIFGADGPSNFAAVMAHLRTEVPHHRGLLVMTDDEGGEVWRLANLLAPLPWARTLGTLSPTQITARVTTAAKAMAALGISMDLAPVLDIDGKDVDPGKADPDGYRSFSGSGAVVTVDGVAYMRGLIAGGVVPVIKHFPGLGGVSPNTDDGPAHTAPWTDVEKVALKPFERAIADGAPALMVSNASIPGLTSLPATVSPAVYSVLRTQLHFSGLTMTDSLSAGAVGAAGLSVERASVDAIEAGADMVLFGFPAHGSAVTLAHEIEQQVFDAVASHALSRATIIAAVAQVLAVKHLDACELS